MAMRSYASSMPRARGTDYFATEPKLFHKPFDLDDLLQEAALGCEGWAQPAREADGGCSLAQLLSASIEAPAPQRPAQGAPTRGTLRPNDRTPSPARDCRGPVDDGYDVAGATASFAAGRRGSPQEQRSEDLRAAASLRAEQAERLLAFMRRPETDGALRPHYDRVREELVAEWRGLLAELHGSGR